MEITSARAVRMHSSWLTFRVWPNHMAIPFQTPAPPSPITAASLVPADHPHPTAYVGTTGTHHLPLLTCVPQYVSCAIPVGFCQFEGEGGEYLRTFSLATTSVLSDSTPSNVINGAVSWLVEKGDPRSPPA